MQKKVKITVAPLWVGVVNFFQADGISRMRNKMENGMKNLNTEKTIEMTAKYFGVSLKEAKQIKDRAVERNGRLVKKGELMMEMRDQGWIVKV
jgi:hypothetical protein